MACDLDTMTRPRQQSKTELGNMSVLWAAKRSQRRRRPGMAKSGASGFGLVRNKPATAKRISRYEQWLADEARHVKVEKAKAKADREAKAKLYPFGGGR
jgi:hypothetical protein